MKTCLAVLLALAVLLVFFAGLSGFPSTLQTLTLLGAHCMLQARCDHRRLAVHLTGKI